MQVPAKQYHWSNTYYSVLIIPLKLAMLHRLPHQHVCTEAIAAHELYLMHIQDMCSSANIYFHWRQNVSILSIHITSKDALRRGEKKHLTFSGSEV